MNPKVKKALDCIEARATNHTWKMRAQLISYGISVARPIEQAIKDLENRRPRIRHKAEKEQLERDLQILRDAAKELADQTKQAAGRVS